jgi:predicted dehydrogenase
MTDTIRWGIVSTANIGLKRLIPAIQKASNGRVVAIASRSLQKAQQAAEQHDIPRAYGSYEALLDDEGIDALYNPLPNNLHTWSIKAAEAGIPTLCEKPLALNAAEAAHIVEAFEARGVPFAEAFMYRFHPRTQRVKKMVDEGAVGEIQTISASFSFRVRDPDNIRLQAELGGGSLMDVGCYCVNLMRHMTGEEPQAVTAQGVWGPQVDEIFAGTLRFPSGAVGHFDCGFRTAFVHTYDIRGDAGRILVEEAFVPQPDADTHIRYWHDGEYEEIAIPPADHYQLMVEDFAAALIEGRPPTFSPQDAVNNMHTLDQLYAAAQPPT